METANSTNHGVPGPEADTALEARIFRIMTVSVTLVVIISAPFVSWRTTAGLALGGFLSLLNYHWLRSSVGGLIAANASDQTVGHSASRYVLRYALIGAVVFGAYTAGFVSLPATIVGLCSFVPAFFAEAFRQFYIAIIHREEIT
jgi:hypothetical protein